MRAPGLLVVAACLLHEAAMARLPQTPKPKVAAPAVLDDDPDSFYTAPGNKECRKCPPGTFVLRPCTVPRTEGTCQPCENSTFSKLSNSFDSCFGCRACRTLDEVETKKCTATTNTECACKNGTFCLPGQPCETCTKCTTSCGPGEKKVRDCTPTRDIKCLPGTTSSPPTSSPGEGNHGWAWFFLPLALVAVLVLGLVCWKKNTSFRNACTGFWGSKSTQFLQYLQKTSSPETKEERDNMLNVERNRRSELVSPSRSAANGHAPGTMIPLKASPPNEDSRGYAEIRKLVPANSKSSAECLSQSFYIFINKVPPRDWNRFMRLLNLTDNEIDSAEKSAQHVVEQKYQMLRTWRDKNGQAATLSVLLEKLNNMGLRGIVEETKSNLIDEHLYVYEDQVFSQVGPS